MEVLTNLGIRQEEAFENFQPAIACLQQLGVAGAKQAVMMWKRLVVLPAASRADYEWFQQQFSLHPASPWTLPGWAADETLGLLLQLNWGKTMWRYARAWLVAPAGAGKVIPLAPLGRPDVARIGDCPLCGAAATLQHYLGECQQLALIVGPAPAPWPAVFNPTASNLEECIRWTGRCLMTVALRRA